jgi:hypothetical protein
MSSSEMVDGSLSMNEPRLVGGNAVSDPATPSEGVDFYGRASAPIDSYPSLLESTTSQPFPLPAISDFTIPSPEFETQPDLGLTFADVSLPTPPIVKGAHNLRLPSFDMLGIASPHPDRIALRTNNSFSLGAGPLSKPEDPLHVLSPPLAQREHCAAQAKHPTTSPEATRARLTHLVPTVTPPTEPGVFNWGTFVNVKTAGLGSPPSSDPGVSPNIQITASATSPAPAIIGNPLSVADLSDALDMAAWV